MKRARQARDQAGDGQVCGDNAGKTLVVVGAPNESDYVGRRMAEWSRAGYEWLDPAGGWQIIDATDDDLTAGPEVLRCPRWALWIDSDIHAFQKAYSHLKWIAGNGGPERVLALHDTGLPHKGLLDNLVTVAAGRCDINLCLLNG
ncbi:hypothetical protein [Halioglobus japonicus]|uniref:Uncharacterized protein n=2 Tax=Halioglobus japonicus TaxID=930805 RepID=A0AAP8MES2_9GAMM|nr:hypothetical protein [Halioglobus japonicus]PLW86119.1 hypothetical protein C0029_06630 [Halioglobus japonicus]